MNYLLVMPKKLSIGASTINVIFPMGIPYISASMKKSGYRVVTANLDFMDGDIASILNTILLENAIDVVCTGGLSLDVHKIKEIITAVRSINPQIKLIVGGGIISSDPEVAMRVLDADIGVIGEGEVTICELAHALDNGLDLQDVPGLIYKTGQDGFLITPLRAEMEDIDNIPFPDFEGFGYRHFVNINGGKGMIISTRSCPMRCTFCFNPTGQTFRQRSLDNLFAEIDFQIKTYNLKSIGFTDELFAIQKQRLYDFCERIKDYNISWACNLRVSDIDEDVLKVVKAAGCYDICYGLESADDTVLKSMKKGITVDQIAHALDTTYQANIATGSSNFIFGDIAETPKTAENTLKFWRQWNNKMHINLTMIQAYPGTYLYDVACRTGVIANREQFLLDECPVINVSKMTDEEFKSLRSQINELQLEPHTPAASVRILEIKANEDCQVEFTCRKCGRKMEQQIFFWYKIKFNCEICGAANEVDPFECADYAQEIFFANLPLERPIALWGAGGIFYKLAREYKHLTSENFVLVDTNKNQQGFSMRGLEICSPKIISERKMETVIITALSHVEAINASLRKYYPSVRNILIPSTQSLDTRVIPALTLFCGT